LLRTLVHLQVFSELSPEPVAAASLAQVYRGKLVVMIP
jgi:predicted unusual protein kinase regulating ubiquinone biosynthesis (AarF/ABC1/UbiB family)